MPGTRGRMGTLPVAYMSESNGSVYSRPASRSRAVTRRASRSMATTSVRMRTSMSFARCCSGVRLTSSASVCTVSAIQYGMPHAEYDVARPRSKATISRSSALRRLRAWLAALIPAASPPTTTSLSRATSGT